MGPLMRLRFSVSLFFIFYCVVYFSMIVVLPPNNYGINLTHFLAKRTAFSDHSMLKVEDRFLKRKSTLQHRCQQMTETDVSKYFDFFVKKRLAYQKHHDFLVCIVAKTGDSTWKAHLNNIRKVHLGEKKTMTPVLEDIPFSTTTTKILTVRHPLKRIISLFGDKFCGGSQYICQTQKPHIKGWYQSAEQVLHLNLGPEGNKSISFEQFLNAILSEAWVENRHIRSVFSNCVPCTVNYDYILHLETFDEDLAYVFNVLNVTETHVDIRVNAQNVSRESTKSYFRDLPKSLLKKVFDHLKVDFDLFDYEIPDFLQQFIV